VSRRVKVPAAEELFRATAPVPERDLVAPADPGNGPAGWDRATDPGGTPAGRDRLRAVPDVAPALAASEEGGRNAHARSDAAAGSPAPLGRKRRPTGRERHHEKITVYVSAEELLDLERARLTLRGEFGLAVDRGRLVREAVAAVLEEFDALGEASTLVRRLQPT
jgi:hypothetical protein